MSFVSAMSPLDEVLRVQILFYWPSVEVNWLKESSQWRFRPATMLARQSLVEVLQVKPGSCTKVIIGLETAAENKIAPLEL